MHAAILSKTPADEALKRSLKHTIVGTVFGVILIFALPTIAPTIAFPVIGAESVVLIAGSLFVVGLIMAYVWTDNFYATLIITGILAAIIYGIGMVVLGSEIAPGALGIVFISSAIGSVAVSPPSMFRRR